MTGGLIGDYQPIVLSPCTAAASTCETLGTNKGEPSTLLTCRDGHLSTIHSAYYHYQPFISILSGESERRS